MNMINFIIIVAAVVIVVLILYLIIRLTKAEKKSEKMESKYKRTASNALKDRSSSAGKEMADMRWHKDK